MKNNIIKILIKIQEKIKIFSKLKEKLLIWLFEKETITIEELYSRYNKTKCKIYNQYDNELKFIEQSENIDNLYVESENNTFIKIEKILKTVEYEEWKIETENGLFLDCADDHIVIKENYEEIYVKDLVVGDKIRTKFGVSKISSILYSNKKSNMFDLELSNNSNHIYYTNDILSHNTTTTASFLLIYSIFNENKHVAIVANKQQTSREILDRIKLMYDYLPMWLKPGIKEWNKNSIIFENGCRIVAYATSSSSIRGQAVSVLYIDEFAFIPHNLVEEFIESTFPAISASKTSRIIITSTPKGKNHFYMFYRNAELGKSDFVTDTIEWDDVPGRDLGWREKQIAELGSEEKFEQEYNAQFIDASNLLISSSILQFIEKTYIKQPITREIYDEKTKTWLGSSVVTDDVTISVKNSYYRGFRIWELPDPKKIYLIVADVSEGKELDYSAFIVVDISGEIFKIVATYQNNTVSTIEYPAVLYSTAKYFNNAYILVENNSVGHSVTNDLWYEYEYEYLVNLDLEGEKKNKKKKYFELGVKTTKKVKKQGALHMKYLIENLKIEFYDERILEELYSFIKKPNGSFVADEGCHDDFAMCILLFAYLFKVNYYFEGIKKEKHIPDLNSPLDTDEEKEDENSLSGFAYIEGNSKSQINLKKSKMDESEELFLKIIMS